MPALARAPPTPEGHSAELGAAGEGRPGNAGVAVECRLEEPGGAGEGRPVEQGVVGKVAQPNSASLLKAAPPNWAPPVKVVLSN